MPRLKSCCWLFSIAMVLILGIGCASKVEEPPVRSPPESAAEPQSQTPVFEDGFESGKTKEWAGDPNEKEGQTEEEGGGEDEDG